MSSFNVWFTADSHFDHAKILNYCNRPFDSVEEMNTALITNWNSVVKPGDRVYHLGDFSFKHGKNNDKIFKQLNGQKHLILGNHDNYRAMKDLGWNWIKEQFGLKIGKYYIFLNHYPMRSWNRSFHGAPHLFGHVHGKMKPWGLSFDVGVDCWNYTPISLETVKQEINKLEQRTNTGETNV